MPSLPPKLPPEWLTKLCSQRSGASLAQSFKLSYTSPLPKVRFMTATAVPLVCVNVFSCLPCTVKYLDKSIFRVGSGHCPLRQKRLVSSWPQSGSRDHEYLYLAPRSALFKHSETSKGMVPPTWVGLPISAKINNAPQADKRD